MPSREPRTWVLTGSPENHASGRMSAAPAERIRTLLLRGDNLLKTQGRAGDSDTRVERARRAFEEARDVARDAAVEPRRRELVERRLVALGPDPDRDGGAG